MKIDKKKPMYLNYKPDSDGNITVWFIYLKIKDSVPVLYGFTQKKSVYEGFKKFRNMNKFYVKKKIFTEEEYYETFIDNIKTNWINYYLEYKKFYTSDSGKYFDRTTIRIVCTGDEEMHVALRTDQVYDLLRKYANKVNSYYLKPSIQDILYFMKYHMFEFEDALWEGEDDNYMEVDQFAIFITLYGATMKNIGETDLECD